MFNNLNIILVQLLDDIGEKFYGVRRKNPLQGMFGELFKVHVVYSSIFQVMD